MHTINTRLDATAIAFQLQHANTKILILDKEHSPVISEALALLKSAKHPIVITVSDTTQSYLSTLPDVDGSIDYETFLASGDRSFSFVKPTDEWDSIALNYTSGTTGNPKGVVYHHRGAYLNALANVIEWNMPLHPRFLWSK